VSARQLTLDEALYGGLPPHVRWSDTSAGAALSMVGKTRRLRRRVLWCVAGRVEGATCDEVEVALGLAHQTVSARIRELVQLECLFDTTARRRTRSGRWARVYRLTPHAHRAWQEAVTADDADEEDGR
jgi:predicted ArsR family transcriptional regulator